MKEKLKDDIDMSKLTPQTTSKVKIEKPQSDKEWEHETGLYNHLYIHIYGMVVGLCLYYLMLLN